MTKGVLSLLVILSPCFSLFHRIGSLETQRPQFGNFVVLGGGQEFDVALVTAAPDQKSC